jgi:hypothetical protein
MKNFILFVLFVLTQNIFSQNLVELKLSENVSINIPDDYYVKDSLGTKRFASKLSDKSVISIVKAIEKKEIIILNKKELKKSYDSFQNGILESYNGNLIKRKIVKHKGMKLSMMNSNAILLNQNVIIYNIAFYLKNHYYIIMFISSEGDNSEAYDYFKRKIIPSIKFKEDLTFKNQFTE